jgi:integrase
VNTFLSKLKIWQKLILAIVPTFIPTFFLIYLIYVEKSEDISIAEAEKDLNDKSNLTKLICCYYYLFAILSGLRTGEQRQLKWSDIAWDEHKINGEEVSIVKLKIRAETSKTRRSREIEITDKGYLDDYASKIWQRLDKKEIGNSLIFSSNGKTAVTKRAISYHFNRLLDLAEIELRNERDLVPYSFMNYFITHKVMSGISYGDIANMCGNSAAQVENTYNHISRATMRTNALAQYKVENCLNV